MKKLTAIGLIITAILTSLSFVNEEPEYKNLKVLPKNISKADMDSTMKHFSKSLGVKCNYCHVRTADNKKFDFASDLKPEKDVARSMFRMTKKINRKHFKNDDVAAITCYTCHNGNKHPETTPPKDEDDE